MRKLQTITQIKSQPSFSKRLVALCFVFILAGCGESKLQQSFDTYTERLAYTLDFDYELVSPTISPIPQTSLVVQVPALKINFRQFYQIDNCALNTIIAERNTTLGKIASASQRFVYENRLGEAIKACIEALGNEPGEQAILNALSDWHNHKQAHKLHYYAQLISQSKELQYALWRAPGMLSGELGDDAKTAALDLQFLLALATQDKHDLNLIEQHLGSIQKHGFYVRHWRSLAFMQANLARLTSLMQPKLAELRCDLQSGKQKMNILRNIFSKYFLSEIQVTSSQINQYSYQLSEHYQQLSEVPELPASLRQYLTEQMALFTAYQEQMTQHIEMWQTFFANCGVSGAQLSEQMRAKK